MTGRSYLQGGHLQSMTGRSYLQGGRLQCDRSLK